MIIHQPEINFERGEFCISTRVELATHLEHFPDRLWFKLPEEYLDYLTDRSDAFLTALIIPMMYLGEDVEVRGRVSPRLASNIESIQHTQKQFHPNLYKIVDIDYRHLERMPIHVAPGGVATAFSGGIDSSYTLWKNLPENQTDVGMQVTHGIFVHGFDILLNNKPLYLSFYQEFKKIFEHYNIQLLQLRTNCYQFTEFRIPWPQAFNFPLISAAMIFGRLLRKFYLPAGDEIVAEIVMKPDVFNDPRVATETFETVLFAPDLQRIDKLKQMADWPVIQTHLRVCSKLVKDTTHANCQQCTKCLNTLIYLELLGIRKRFKEFQSHPFHMKKSCD